jgi:ubiquinone/menaquinone biosynthesis C-methylase UbiE
MKLRSLIAEKGWDRYARWYDFVQPRVIRLFNFFGGLTFEQFQERVVELADLQKGDVVLDVACGTGAAHPAILRRLGPRGKLIAVDFSTEMLRQAETRARRLGLRRVQYLKANVEELSAIFEKESFDVIISVNGLPQFLHPDKALLEMVYVLRPGGRLSASTIDRDKCDEDFVLRWFMKPAPRLWHQDKYGREMRKMGFENLRFIEQGRMMFIAAEKSAKKKRQAG